MIAFSIFTRGLPKALTQNPKKKRAGLDGNNGKLTERMVVGAQIGPKRLRFCFETTYGPEGRGSNPSRRTKVLEIV